MSRRCRHWSQSGGRNETFPGSDCCGRIGVCELCCARAAINAKLPREYTAVLQIFAANNGGVPVRGGHQPCWIVSQNELASQDKGLRLQHFRSCCTSSTAGRTYPAWLLLWYKMSRALHKHVRPTSFLMYDTSKLTVVAEPMGRWPPRKALDPAECCVLSGQPTQHCDVARANAQTLCIPV